jgi:hypothetical protein
VREEGQLTLNMIPSSTTVGKVRWRRIDGSSARDLQGKWRRRRRFRELRIDSFVQKVQHDEAEMRARSKEAGRCGTAGSVAAGAMVPVDGGRTRERGSRGK